MVDWLGKKYFKGGKRMFGGQKYTKYNKMNNNNSENLSGGKIAAKGGRPLSLPQLRA